MNTRKDNNGKAIKAWKTLGPAKVFHPLRLIRNKCAVTTIKNGARVTEYVHPYPFAMSCANAGDGGSVQNIAMHLAIV